MASDADVVVVGGGDGTVATAAGKLIGRTDKALGILPLGTLNLYAKDLGIPLPSRRRPCPCWRAAGSGRWMSATSMAPCSSTIPSSASIRLMVQEREEVRDEPAA